MSHHVLRDLSLFILACQKFLFPPATSSIDFPAFAGSPGVSSLPDRTGANISTSNGPHAMQTSTVTITVDTLVEMAKTTIRPMRCEVLSPTGESCPVMASCWTVMGEVCVPTIVLPPGAFIPTHPVIMAIQLTYFGFSINSRHIVIVK